MEEKESWNHSELRELCDPAQKESLRLYCNAFHWKLGLSDFHANKCNELLEKYYSKPQIVLGGEDYATFQYEFEGHFLGYTHILHTCADTFAQILNIVLLAPPMSEETADLQKVKAKIVRQGTDLIWEQKINKFLDSSDFKYINGFVNISKHRHLLNHRYKINLHESEFRAGFQYDAFNYKGESFPGHWADDIIKMRQTIRTQLVKMGSDLNDYLQLKKAA